MMLLQIQSGEGRFSFGRIQGEQNENISIKYMLYYARLLIILALCTLFADFSAFIW